MFQDDLVHELFRTRQVLLITDRRDRLGEQCLSKHFLEHSGHDVLLCHAAVFLNAQYDRVGRGEEGIVSDASSRKENISANRYYPFYWQL